MARKRLAPEQIVAILREAERGAERKALPGGDKLDIGSADVAGP
jgi:hypothetical protein